MWTTQDDIKVVNSVSSYLNGTKLNQMILSPTRLKALLKRFYSLLI